VIRTFLEHLLATENIEADNRIVERPVGALIISIQAVSNVVGLESNLTLKFRSTVYSYIPWMASSNHRTRRLVHSQRPIGVITILSLDVAQRPSNALPFSSRQLRILKKNSGTTSSRQLGTYTIGVRLGRGRGRVRLAP
jgi:hypothetical protein